MLRIWSAAGDLVKTLDPENATALLSVAWRGDGSRLGAAGFAGEIIVWDAGSYEELDRKQCHSVVRALAWSPSGDILAAGDDAGRVTLWDGNNASAAPIARLSGHTGLILDLVWSPDDGRIASASGDRSMRVWDVETRQLIHAFADQTGPVQSVDWSPDGKRLVCTIAAPGGAVHLWDAETGHPVLRLRLRPGMSVAAVAWSPDGRRLATSGVRGYLRIWDASHGYAVAPGPPSEPGASTGLPPPSRSGR